MSGHTPGPWSAKRQNGHLRASSRLHIFDSQFRVVTVMSGSMKNACSYEANARLIAAAPELLEALKSCAAVCAGQVFNKKGLIESLELARAAIAKATGEPA